MLVRDMLGWRNLLLPCQYRQPLVPALATLASALIDPAQRGQLLDLGFLLLLDDIDSTIVDVAVYFLLQERTPVLQQRGPVAPVELVPIDVPAVVVLQTLVVVKVVDALKSRLDVHIAEGRLRLLVKLCQFVHAWRVHGMINDDESLERLVGNAEALPNLWALLSPRVEGRCVLNLNCTIQILWTERLLKGPVKARTKNVGESLLMERRRQVLASLLLAHLNGLGRIYEINGIIVE